MDKQNFKKIVVVDDTLSVAFILKNYLEDEGFSVAAYEDPKEALDFLKENGADLVITDFKMPGMNGLELLSQLQNSHPLTNAIIISADPERIIQTQTQYPVIEKTHGFIQKTIDAVNRYLKGRISQSPAQ
jgi:CheY-like chemotaxis protein